MHNSSNFFSMQMTRDLNQSNPTRKRLLANRPWVFLGIALSTSFITPSLHNVKTGGHPIFHGVFAGIIIGFWGFEMSSCVILRNPVFLIAVIPEFDLDVSLFWLRFLQGLGPLRIATSEPALRRPVSEAAIQIRSRPYWIRSQKSGTSRQIP